MRQFGRQQQVAAAHLVNADADFTGGGFDQPLHDIGRFRAAGTAIGVDRRGVGHNAVHQIVDRRDTIDAAHDAAAGHRLDCRAELRLIGAQIGPGFHLQRQDAALRIERQSGFGFHGAAVGIGLEGVAAFTRPLHRAAQMAGGVQAQRIFGIEEALHAEAAADIVGHDPHLFDRHLQDGLCQLAAHGGNALAAGGQREAFAFAILTQRGTHFHRRGCDSVLDDLQARHMRGAGNGGIGRRAIAHLPIEQAVRFGFRPDQGCIRRKRGSDAGDGGQFFIIHENGFGTGAGRLAAFGDNKGDTIAHKAHAIIGQQHARGFHVT